MKDLVVAVVSDDEAELVVEFFEIDESSSGVRVDGFDSHDTVVVQ